MKQNESPEKQKQNTRAEVIFEFSVPEPRLTHYRGVKATDGVYRMEMRGDQAKHFRANSWCGDLATLFKAKEIIERSQSRV